MTRFRGPSGALEESDVEMMWLTTRALLRRPATMRAQKRLEEEPAFRCAQADRRNKDELYQG